MDAIIALAHFCEIHGPCVILCTQRCKKEPEQLPHSLTVLWCEACQSLELDQALMSKKKDVCFVSTRTPLQQDVAFLLKQAAIRSLSCEETNKEGGAIYFGDSERGHVISHCFSLQDTLARGFQRKYSILVLMRDKIHLLNNWTMLTKHIGDIILDLQQKAEKANGGEQSKIVQRAVRQARGSSSNPTRSLTQLINESGIYAHLHLWFSWMLDVETAVEKSLNVPDFPASCSGVKLKYYFEQISEQNFQKFCYCILAGIKVEADQEVIEAFSQLLPKNFSLPSTGDICKLYQMENVWHLSWKGNLPLKLPQLQVSIIKALKCESMPESALDPHLTSLVMQWYNIACAVSLAPVLTPNLLNALGVQKCDMPLLSYWASQCKKD